MQKFSLSIIFKFHIRSTSTTLSLVLFTQLGYMFCVNLKNCKYIKIFLSRGKCDTYGYLLYIETPMCTKLFILYIYNYIMRFITKSYDFYLFTYINIPVSLLNYFIFCSY